MEIEEVFERVLERLRVTKPSVMRGWFRSLEPVSFEAGSLCIRVQNAAQKEYLERFADSAFTSAAQEVTGRLVSVVFESANDETVPIETIRTDYPLRQISLEPVHTLSSFAIGDSNRLAHAAISSVIDSRCVAYNPLFIWGAEGVGKTHLLQALAERFQSESSQGESRRSWYTTGPALIDQIIESVELDRMAAFREAVANLNLFILDDVHTLADRERSQEEFFHLFNGLAERHVQMVFSSAAAPSELHGFAQRLISRFSAGLVVGMDPPLTETRVAIVHLQAKIRGIDIADFLSADLASRIDSPKQLVATLIYLDSLSQVRAAPITKTLVDEVLTAKK